MCLKQAVLLILEHGVGLLERERQKGTALPTPKNRYFVAIYPLA